MQMGTRTLTVKGRPERVVAFVCGAFCVWCLLFAVLEVGRSPSPDCPPTARAVGVGHPHAVGAGVLVWGPITAPLACMPCGGCVPRGWRGAVPGGMSCHRCFFVYLFVNKTGNHLLTPLDLEDGFHQMPLSECSRQYTAFCTPFGVFEWRVLPMGVKVGTQAFETVMSDCLKSQQPHTHIYIDDLLTGTRPRLCGKGKIRDSKAYLEDHFHKVVKVFQKLEECNLKVRFEKMSSFYGKNQILWACFTWGNA